MVKIEFLRINLGVLSVFMVKFSVFEVGNGVFECVYG
jgi:hypothetical protein